MPKISTDIPDHQDYITRPIAMKIAQEVISETGLRPTDIIYIGTAEQMMNTGSSVDEPTKLSSFSESGQVKVSVEEEFRPESLMTSGILAGNKRTVFHDDESDVYMVPVRTDATMTLELTYAAATEAEARSWLNRMQQALERRLEITSHSVPYSYPIPYEYVAAISAIHSLRESGPEPYGETLKDYLHRCFSSKVAVRAKLNGQSKQFVIEETQHDILGTLDFDELPKPSKAGNIFTVSFTYTVRYQRPFAMVLDYPLLVNNQLVDNELLPRVNRNELLPMDSTVISNWFDGVINVTKPTQQRIGGFSIPEFDDWKVPHPPSGTGSIFRIMIAVDPLDTTLIVDLNELGEYKLNEDVVRLMQYSGHLLFEYAHAPILVTLYENNTPIDPAHMELDGTVFRVTGRVLNPRNKYHLRIAMITDLAMLSENANASMLMFPRATRTLLMALEPSLISDGKLPSIKAGHRLDEIEYRKAVEHVNYTCSRYRALGYTDRIRVGYMTVSAHRSE